MILTIESRESQKVSDTNLALFHKWRLYQMSNAPSLFDWLSIGLAVVGLILGIIALKFAMNARDASEDADSFSEEAAEAAKEAANNAKSAAEAAGSSASSAKRAAVATEASVISAARSAEAAQSALNKLIEKANEKDGEDKLRPQ
jgi:predicted lipid-binding transport protein (Tim44 family)